MYGIRIIAKLGGVTHQAKFMKRTKDKRKNKIILKKLDMMVWPDGIQIDNII